MGVLPLRHNPPNLRRLQRRQHHRNSGQSRRFLLRQRRLRALQGRAAFTRRHFRVASRFHSNTIRAFKLRPNSIFSDEILLPTVIGFQRCFPAVVDFVLMFSLPCQGSIYGFNCYAYSSIYPKYYCVQLCKRPNNGGNLLSNNFIFLIIYY